MPAGLAGAKGLTPEELLGSVRNRDILNTAGLREQSYWHRLKQRMQPPVVQRERSTLSPYRGRQPCTAGLLAPPTTQTEKFICCSHLNSSTLRLVVL